MISTDSIKNTKSTNTNTYVTHNINNNLTALGDGFIFFEKNEKINMKKCDSYFYEQNETVKNLGFLIFVDFLPTEKLT